MLCKCNTSDLAGRGSGRVGQGRYGWVRATVDGGYGSELAFGSGRGAVGKRREKWWEGRWEERWEERWDVSGR